MSEQVTTAARMQREIDRQFKRCVERKVADTGVYRSQHMMLMCLGDNPGCSQAKLAEITDVSAAAITTTLQKLEKGGYISRETKADDNRTNSLEITEKGKKVICQSKRLFKQIECDMYEGFSEEELERLQGFYQRIYENLKKQNEKEA